MVVLDLTCLNRMPCFSKATMPAKISICFLLSTIDSSFPCFCFLLFMVHSGMLGMVTLEGSHSGEGQGRAVRLKTASAHSNDLQLQKTGQSTLPLQLLPLPLFFTCLFLLLTLCSSGTSPPAHQLIQPTISAETRPGGGVYSTKNQPRGGNLPFPHEQPITTDLAAKKSTVTEITEMLPGKKKYYAKNFTILL